MTVACRMQSTSAHELAGLSRAGPPEIVPLGPVSVEPAPWEAVLDMAGTVKLDDACSHVHGAQATHIMCQREIGVCR